MCGWWDSVRTCVWSQGQFFLLSLLQREDPITVEECLQSPFFHWCKAAAKQWKILFQGSLTLVSLKHLTCEDLIFLRHSLVGHLKSDPAVNISSEWPDRVWGRMPVKVKLLEEGVVYLLGKEVDKVLQSISGLETLLSFPLERWIEVLGCPSRVSWFRFRGVPLHA